MSIKITLQLIKKFLYNRSSAGHIMPKCQLCTFSSDPPKIFLHTFWTPGSKIMQLKNWFIHSFIHSFSHSFSHLFTLSSKMLSPRLRSLFWSYLYEIWSTVVSMWCLETFEGDFLKFLIFFGFKWDLANFLGEIQTTSKSKFYGFYEVSGPILDYFIKGCTVQKLIFFEILLLFMIL